MANAGSVKSCAAEHEHIVQYSDAFLRDLEGNILAVCTVMDSVSAETLLSIFRCCVESLFFLSQFCDSGWSSCFVLLNTCIQWESSIETSNRTMCS